MRVPPHSIEAEVSLLGGLLIAGDAFQEVSSELTPEDFYKESHRHIYRAMETLSSRGQAIDVVTIMELLRGEGNLETVGGLPAVSTLASQVPTAANIKYYAEIVRKKAVLRKIISFAGEIAEECYGEVSDIEFSDEEED